ncbi:tail collar fiber protein [Acinetobacter phage Acj9]|uniref:Gp12 short tail fibers protein n=1 Tax=Acinetobacter phage Acj9 TaxID=760939 RepID=E5EPV3_9CAUD|nr:tail collar fiber protein [Acinetobacter phage Acj9]ADG60069.1 gp12 short tail fibers protein [Acinetobacter phage Acj9]
MAETPLNNTYKHISDEARYTSFDPTSTQFPESVVTVQDALNLTSPTSYSTTTKAGVITLATADEVIAGIDALKAVTPATLAARLQHPDASTTQKGVLFLATDVEAQTGTNTTKGIVPSSLKYTLDWNWDNRTALETRLGTIKISTSVAAIAGADDTTAMTPLKVKQAIAAATSNLPVPTPATEQAQGLVQLATIGQVQQGLLREGYAISPYTLMRTVGSLTNKGVVQAASQVAANLGVDDGLYISAKGFKTYSATIDNAGTVKLTKTISQAPGSALASNADVLFTTAMTQQTVTGPVNFTGQAQLNGSKIASEQHVMDSMPIGSTQMYLGDTDPVGGKWKIANGPQLSKAQYPEFFALIGYKFGGSGDVFYGPDMRGLFVRGVGEGRDILAARGVDSKNKPLLGNDVSGGAVGEVQKQQVIKHKHVTTWGESNRSGSGYTFGGTQGNRFMGDHNPADFDNSWMFTNDGTEIESDSIRREYSTLNSAELMGGENRPWNMSLNYIIKVA